MLRKHSAPHAYCFQLLCVLLGVIAKKHTLLSLCMCVYDRMGVVFARMVRTYINVKIHPAV